MIEHKFRAWHKEQHKMYSAEELGNDQVTLMPDGRGFANISGKDTRLSQIDNGRKMIPLEYIGKHDKNGKEIYEADIVKIWDPIYQVFGNVCVEYEPPCFRLRWAASVNSPLIDISRLRTFSDGEVIGNKWENPELMKEVE